jgi:uncharacterized membrane protein YfcA
VYLLCFLFFAAVVGGALNSVAGGGSFIGLPALLYAGIPPVAANATTTLALWPGAVSSAVAYRRDIRASLKTLLVLGAVSLIGGLLGALLLVRTSDTSFMRLLPWLMLVAATAFTFGNRLTPRASSGPPRHFVAPWAVALQLVIAVYGGYFGGGIGIMMLASMTVAGMTDIHEMNGLKSTLGATINGIALAEFIIKRAVYWRPGLVMVAGGILGGYAGASLARRIDRRHVRVFVITVGWAMTTYFFLRKWLP